MVGVEYTGNETHDDYNEYYYVEKAPFGAENVRSYRYRGLIRDPNRKKSKRRDYSGVRRKALKEMLGFGADYTESGNVAADVMVGYEWTIYDMDDDDIDNDELLSLIDSAVQDHIIYEYENERDPSSQGITYVNYVNEDEKVEELNVYYRYDINVELGAEDERVVCFICKMTPEETDGEYGPMMSTLGGDACKTCAEDYGYEHPRDMIYMDSESFEPEPLNMQGAVGVLMAIAGVLILKL